MSTETSSSVSTAGATTPELAAGVAQFLAPVVIDMEALVVNGKQAHWNVRGADFIAIHELLDQLVVHAQSFADDSAERIVALGLPVDSRLASVAAKTTLPELSDGFQDWKDTVAQVVSLIDAALVTVRVAVEGLDEVDLNSQDIVIGIERGLVKDRWLLQSHLAA